MKRAAREEENELRDKADAQAYLTSVLDEQEDTVVIRAALDDLVRSCRAWTDNGEQRNAS